MLLSLPTNCIGLLSIAVLHFARGPPLKPMVAMDSIQTEVHTATMGMKSETFFSRLKDIFLQHLEIANPTLLSLEQMQVAVLMGLLLWSSNPLTTSRCAVWTLLDMESKLPILT